MSAYRLTRRGRILKHFIVSMLIIASLAGFWALTVYTLLNYLTGPTQ